jgi:hypothetical protein
MLCAGRLIDEVVSTLVGFERWREVGGEQQREPQEKLKAAGFSSRPFVAHRNLGLSAACNKTCPGNKPWNLKAGD